MMPNLALSIEAIAAIGVRAGFDPAVLFEGGALGAWYDPSDLSTMFQDSAGTTPAAVDSPVGRINDKSGNGNHMTQGTAANRPMLRQSGAIYYLEFDGTNDELETASGRSLPASSDLAVVLHNAANDTSFVTFYEDSIYWLALAASGDAGVLNTGYLGSPGYAVNGAAVAPPTRAALYTALGSAARKVLQVTSIDTTQNGGDGGWDKWEIGNYSGFPFGGRVHEIIFCPAQSAEVRDQIRAYLTSKWGVA